MKLQEHLIYRSEDFLAASLPPDGASLPFASCMKSSSWNEPGKEWNSSFGSPFPCKTWRWLHKEGDTPNGYDVHGTQQGFTSDP